MKTAHLFIEGNVIGVGFRQFIKSNAKALGLTGFVRNLRDGRVEAVLQGSRKKIEELILLSRKGPFLAEVKEVKVSYEEQIKAYDTFDILN